MLDSEIKGTISQRRIGCFLQSIDNFGLQNIEIRIFSEAIASFTIFSTVLDKLFIAIVANSESKHPLKIIRVAVVFNQIKNLLRVRNLSVRKQEDSVFLILLHLALKC